MSRTSECISFKIQGSGTKKDLERAATYIRMKMKSLDCCKDALTFKDKAEECSSFLPVTLVFFLEKLLCPGKNQSLSIANKRKCLAFANFISLLCPQANSYRLSCLVWQFTSTETTAAGSYSIFSAPSVCRQATLRLSGTRMLLCSHHPLTSLREGSYNSFSTILITMCERLLGRIRGIAWSDCSVLLQVGVAM